MIPTTPIPTTLINGKPQKQVDAGDRGLAYGQGVFETILVHSGTAQFWNWHIERLLDGCRRIGIPERHLAEQLKDELPPLPDHGAIKIIVTRGAGGRGYAVNEPMEPTRIIQLSELPSWPDRPRERGVRVTRCETRLAHQPLLAGVKHLNRLEQVLARAEWSDPRIREGLVRDTEGNLIEGTMSNLFLVRNGRLCTPELSRCGVAGVLRRWVLAKASGSDWEIEVGKFGLEALVDADELFLCNSLIGIWPVVEYEGRAFPVGEKTRALQRALEQEYDAC